MEKFLLFPFLVIILLSSLPAQCSDGQININTASATDLDKITYIGSATATKIINMRPFNSVNDLLNVSGIGETKLKAIKDENLACVENSEEKETFEEEKEAENIEETIEEETSVDMISFQENLTQEIKEPQKIQELQSIKLNSKDIKNDNSIQENKEENLGVKYANLGLIALCILLLILLFLQNRKHGIE